MDERRPSVVYTGSNGQRVEGVYPPARFAMLAANWRVAIVWDDRGKTRSYDLNQLNLWRLQRTLARHGVIVRVAGNGSTWLIGGNR